MSRKCGIMFVKKGGFFGFLVSLFQWEFKYDHVAIYTPDYVYEILITRNPDGDIVYDRIEQYQQKNKIYKKVYIPDLDEITISNFINQNKNKKYDWWRSISWVTRKIKEIDDKSKWNCVDMCYETCKKGGVEISDGKNSSPKKIFQNMKNNKLRFIMSLG